MDIMYKIQQFPVAYQLTGATVLVVCSALVVYSIASKFFSKGQAPPTISCLPIIGGFLKFIKGPLPLMKEAFQAHGDVFTVPVFHKRITFLIGPEVSSHFYKATDLQLSQKEVYEFNVPTFGKGVVFDVDHTVRLEQFRFFAEALKTSRMRTYVSMMVSEAEAFFSKWGERGTLDLKEQLSDLIILTASRTLMGPEVRENLFEKVSNLFHDLDMGMQPISVVFPYLPIAAHRKRDSSRAELAQIFSKIITNRRARGVEEPDVLQAFMDARYKNGTKLTDDEVCGMLIAVLFAGQHTSSVTSTWTGMLALATKSENWPRLVAEQKKVMAKHGDKLDYDILNEMDELHFCIKEALRLHPPLIMLMRYVHEAFSVTTSTGQEYHIPKGNIVATSPSFAHRLERVYKEPAKYDPQRFAKPREEDKKQPFSFTGFGGGRHGCMGESFAYMQIKTIWSILIRNFDFDLAGPLPEPDYDSMVVGPKGACMVDFVRQKL